MRAYEKAIRIEPPDKIFAALQRQLAARGPDFDPKFHPHASTWLNQERWTDEIIPFTAKPKTAREQHNAALAEFRATIDALYPENGPKGGGQLGLPDDFVLSAPITNPRDFKIDSSGVLPISGKRVEGDSKPDLWSSLGVQISTKHQRN